MGAEIGQRRGDRRTDALAGAGHDGHAISEQRV
jgi:hypothetical protein